MSSEFAKRLLRHEEMPPEGAWQLIAGKLQLEKGQTLLAGRLQEYEVTPPPGTWNRLSSQLLQLDGIAVPRQPRIRKMVYRWSAAAIVAGIVAVGSIYFFRNNGLRGGDLQPLALKTNSNIAPQPISTFRGMIKSSVPSKSLAILNKAKAVFKRKRQRTEEDLPYIPNAVVSLNPFPLPDTLLSVMVNAKLIRNENGAIIQNLSLLYNGDNRYIPVTSPSGQQTRISSKFINAMVYLKDNNYLENFQGSIDKSFLESLAWKLRFETWRKKLLETPFTPSSYNFLDIFQLKELITNEE